MIGSTGGTLLLSLLVLFAFYRRLRRSVGRQRISPPRLAIRVIVFGVLSVVAAVILGISSPAYLVTGVAGAGLAWFALRFTAFEHDLSGGHYTPNTIIGLGVFSLFLGRISYRLLTLIPLLRAGEFDPRSFASGQDGPPTTLAILLLLTAYYTTYYTAVLIKGRSSTSTG